MEHSMPRKESAEITLGGETYVVETPDLDQLWAITELQTKAAAATTKKESFDVTVEVLCVLIKKPRAAIRATMAELVDALPIAMRVSGLEEMQRRGRELAKKAKAPARASAAERSRGAGATPRGARTPAGPSTRSGG